MEFRIELGYYLVSFYEVRISYIRWLVCKGNYGCIKFCKMYML